MIFTVIARRLHSEFARLGLVCRQCLGVGQGCTVFVVMEWIDQDLRKSACLGCQCKLQRVAATVVALEQLLVSKCSVS